MNDFTSTARAFVEMAHGIVWCSMATVDRLGRPRSRVLHPMWELDGERLTGWIGTLATPLKRAHLEHSPYVSCNYWSPAQDTCVAECRAELLTDDATSTRVWERFTELPPPLGYDPYDMPMWQGGPTSPEFAVIKLDPWRLKVFPAVYGESNGEEGEILVWKRAPDA